MCVEGAILAFELQTLDPLALLGRSVLKKGDRHLTTIHFRSK
jgi:hypothetical protein